jgi:recombination protein RecA
MALPASLLERLPLALARPGGALSADIRLGSGPQPTTRHRLVLPLGQELDQVLPDGGLLRGGVVELSVKGGSGLATAVALSACRAAQEEARRFGGAVPWCSFVDPSATLYAPGVAQEGVALDRLLVVRPPLEALSRVALRLVESQAFAVTVIDTVGTPGAELDVALGTWPRIVRRLSMALEGSAGVVLLITDAASARPLPLPVAMRIELGRPAPDQLSLRIAKDKYGRVSGPRSIAWARRPREAPSSLGKQASSELEPRGAASA